MPASASAIAPSRPNVSSRRTVPTGSEWPRHAEPWREVDLEAAAAEIEDRARRRACAPSAWTHRLADEPRLLLALDHFELDAGLVIEAVEQDVAVRRVADRAGRDRAVDRRRRGGRSARGSARTPRPPDRSSSASSSPRVNALWPRRTGMRSASMRTSSVGAELRDHDADRVRSGVDRTEPDARVATTTTLARSERLTRVRLRPSVAISPSAPTAYFFGGGLPPPPGPTARGLGGPAFSGILILSALVDAATAPRP